MKQHLLTVAIALVAGFGGAAIWSFSGLGNQQVRDYLVANPQVLPEMDDALRQNAARERLASLGDAVTAPFPGAVLGNPNGSKTIVKFTDYACGFCRSSVADVERLIAEDPELRVVIRELPIFEGSEAASRMALAAASQNRFSQFYHAMFEAGPPDDATILAAAGAANLDMGNARQDAGGDAATAEIAANLAMARELGFGGTPSWVIGDQLIEGAVGYDGLKAALARTQPS